MRAIDRLLMEYGASHQNPTNKSIHWICVPAIFWSITGLLWSVQLPYFFPGTTVFLNGAMLALLLVFIYYIQLSSRLAGGMLLFSVVCILLCYWIDVWLLPGKLWLIALAVFVAAWFGQFVGHQIEGKKPSFFKDLQFLLIGPAWLMHFLYKKAGIRY
jgi:uncharacterized membrane protein YGL010W